MTLAWECTGPVPVLETRSLPVSKAVSVLETRFLPVSKAGSVLETRFSPVSKAVTGKRGSTTGRNGEKPSTVETEFRLKAHTCDCH